jgi:outer membrane protein insertion porin family
VRLKLVLVPIVIAILAGTLHAEKIKEILVEENKKTTREQVLLIADVEVGDNWQPTMVDEIKANLVNSGLFKESEVYYDTVPGGVRLHILAKDKHSWVIAPTAYNQPTNKGGGVGFGENNLFGEGKKLLMYGQIATGESFFVGAYVDPNIAGSARFHWQADVFLRSARIIEYEPPQSWFGDPKPLRTSRMNYLNGGVRFGVNLWKRHPIVSLDGRLRGAHVGFSSVEKGGPGDFDNDLTADPPIEEITGDPTSTTVPKPGAEGWDISSEVSLGFDTRANWYGVQTGSRLKLAFERSLPALGSDFDYWLANVHFDISKKFLARHNLVIRADAGYGRNIPFQQEYLVGGTQMRGWKNNQFHGNLRFQVNTEYSVPLFTIRGLGFRALAFWDSAYITFTRAGAQAELDSQRDYLPESTWDNSGRKALAPFKNSVGGGIRLFLRQIVIPLLGLDFGYGIERKSYEVYIAIGLTD